MKESSRFAKHLCRAVRSPVLKLRYLDSVVMGRDDGWYGVVEVCGTARTARRVGGRWAARWLGRTEHDIRWIHRWSSTYVEPKLEREIDRALNCHLDFGDVFFAGALPIQVYAH